MTDHRDYHLRNEFNDSDVIDAENYELGNDKENNVDFDKNLIALIKFQPWIYDKKEQEKQDEDSMAEGWQAIADSLESTGMYI